MSDNRAVLVGHTAFGERGQRHTLAALQLVAGREVDQEAHGGGVVERLRADIQSQLEHLELLLRRIVREEGLSAVIVEQNARKVLGMIPGISQIPGIKDMQVDEKQFRRIAAIIKSMTPAEREDPDILNASRRRRIAEAPCWRPPA